MNRLQDKSLSSYLQEVAGRQSTPGGGAVAAVVAAEGCALIGMVARFSKGEQFASIASRTDAAAIKLLSLADEDGEAFSKVMKAFRGEGNLNDSLIAAASVPEHVIYCCLPLIDDLEELAERGNINLVSDIAIAASLFHSAITSSELNILINTKSLEIETPKSLQQTLGATVEILKRLDAAVARVKSDLQ
jgi:formiminotetrahydrofolate cyclodeaminase